MTLVLAPPPPGERIALPIAAALAVREALARRFALPTRMKWPNDLLVGRRKVAGIIAEASAAAVLLGVGVNLAAPEEALPADLRPIATSVRIETGRAPAAREAALAIVDELERLYPRWIAGDASLREEAERALIREHRVRWRAPSGMLVEGLPRGIGPSGELAIDAPAGAVTVRAGDLEILWPT
jgi:BirA family biotin operon repressor/biotin-[acetyl-CoA-carboxylase] ligase